MRENPGSQYDENTPQKTTGKGNMDKGELEMSAELGPSHPFDWNPEQVIAFLLENFLI